MNSDRPPVSSGPVFSAPAAPSEDEPDEIRAIWGTTVNLGETMKTFREFLRGFKIKYRVNHDREQGRHRTLGSPEEGEVVLYEQYLRRMRQTGETNLNLDMANLLAYPPSKKLYAQLAKYPQEVVPAMDQVLKDLMLELAEQDQNDGFDEMSGAQGEEEIADIMTKVYKIRPFGIETVNMRELNPTGKHPPLPLFSQQFPYVSISRYRQARLHQGSGDPCYSRHPRHESRLLPLFDLPTHRTGRN